MQRFLKALLLKSKHGKPVDEGSEEEAAGLPAANNPGEHDSIEDSEVTQARLLNLY